VAGRTGAISAVIDVSAMSLSCVASLQPATYVFGGTTWSDKSSGRMVDAAGPDSNGKSQAIANVRCLVSATRNEERVS
jgi:hypothetical protein